MSLSGYHDWEADQWEFVYDLPANPSESTGEISPIGPGRQNPLEGLANFGISLVRGIFDLIGDALSGGLRLGSAVVGAVIGGAVSLIGGVVDFFGNIFFGWAGKEKKPLPPIYSDIFTDIEAATQPFFDAVDKNIEDIKLIEADLAVNRQELSDKLDEVEADIRDAEASLEAVGDVDKKIADQAAIHTREATEALQEARNAMSELDTYKTTTDAKIQAELGKAQDALDSITALEGDLETSAEQISVADTKAQKAINDLAAYKTEADAEIAALKLQAQNALNKAGDALSEYDSLWEEHSDLKLNASSSIEALRTLTDSQTYKIETLEGDLPGIKTSITNVFALAETAQSTVDNLQIGGRNLALRRDFATSTEHHVIERTNDSFFTGEPIFHAVKLSNATQPVGLSSSPEVNPGEYYTASIWVRTANESGAVPVIRFYSGGVLASSSVITRAGEWVKRAVTYQNEGEVPISPSVLFYPQSGAGSETWFTSPKLERGNKATDWTPAPEDVAADIATAQAKADKAEQDAITLSNAAQVAAELYAKEKTEADVAQLKLDAAAEALRVAEEAANQAVLDSASDADTKLALAEKALKEYTDAQAALAKEQAEENAAKDASTKADQAKADAEAKAAELADDAKAAAENVQTNLDNLQVGGRNLMRYSGGDALNTTGLVYSPQIVTEAGKKALAFNSSNNIIYLAHGGAPVINVGETVTFSFWAKATKEIPLGRVYLGPGAGNSNFLQNETVTTEWKRFSFSHTPSVELTPNVHMYPKISNGDGTYETFFVTEWKLERGNKATDWTLAPEDVDKSIADVDYKADETAKLIPGMQESITGAHGKAEEAQRNLDNLQIGGRNLRRNSNSFSDYGTYMGSVRNEIEEGVSVPEWGARDATRMKYTRGNSDLLITPQVDHLRGETVTFSYWLKNVGTTPIRVRYNGLTPSGTSTYEPGFSGRVTHTGKLRSDYNWFQHQLYFEPNAEEPDNSSIEFILWRSKLEVGNKATDWTPAPEDTEAEIEAAVQASADALNSYRTSNDKAVSDANDAAAKAAGLADSKGEVIYQSTAPTGTRASTTNLWIRTSDNAPHTYDGSKWVAVTDKVAKDAAQAASDANNLAKSKTTTYYQTTAPSASASVVGDLWIDQSTAGKNTLKRWSGSAWVAVQDKAIQEALANAGTAQSTADGKVRTFAQTSAPTGMASKDVGDLWIDTDDGNKLHRWTGSAWVSLQDAAIKAAQDQADKALEAGTIQDTRSVNEPPSYYWKNHKRTTVKEFKSSSALGTSGGYGVLTTVIPWNDSSGGAITQEFNVNNSDTVLYRRSTGSGETATWTEWKDRAKDLADSITALGNDLAAKTGPDSTLQANITALDEATGEQYRELNNDLWGENGDLWKINNLLWNDQGKLNTATELFKDNIKGWQKDVYNAFVDFDKVNQSQDGLIATNNRAIKAQQQVLSSHQRLVGMVLPSSSLVPLQDDSVDPEWARGLTQNSNGAWLVNKTVQPGSTTTHVPVDSALTYRAQVRVRRVNNVTTPFSIRLRLPSGTSNASVTYVTAANTEIPVGAKRQTFLASNINITSAVGEWETWVADFTFSSSVTSVRVGYVLGSASAPVEVAELEVYPLLPSQLKVNKALSDADKALSENVALEGQINKAQTSVLNAHQRILDMTYPGASLVGKYPEGVDLGSDGVLDYYDRPYWAGAATPMKGGAGDPEIFWRFPDIKGINASSWYSNLIGTGDQLVPSSPGGRYRISFRIRTSGLLTSQFGMLLETGLAGAVSWEGKVGTTANGPVNSGSLMRAFNTQGSWQDVEIEVTLTENAEQVKFYILPYNSTDLTIKADIADLEISPILPSQMKVNEGFSQAIEANTKAIRLAFPDMNLDPKLSTGHPEWSKPSAVTVVTSGNPGGRNPAYRVAGTTNDGGLMEFQPDIREYRVRGFVTPGPASAPKLTFRLLNGSSANIIEAWRPTFPADEDSVSFEDSLKSYDEVQWTEGVTVTLTPQNGMVGSPGEWAELDITVRIKAGENSGKVSLIAPTTTNNWVLVNDLRVTALNPSQWQTDYAQNRALTGLREAFRAQEEVNTNQGEIDQKLTDSQQSLLGSMREIQSAVWRVFPVSNLGYNSATELNPHFQVRKGNSGTVYVDARGVSWTGDMIVTAFYEEGPPFMHVAPVTTGVSGRTVNVPRRTPYPHNGEIVILRIDYRVDPERVLGTKTKENFDPGSTPASVVDLQFDPGKTSSQAPNNGADGVFTDSEITDSVLHYVDWEVTWDATTAEDSYLMEVNKETADGTLSSVRILRVDGPGPTFPWQDGRRKTTINTSVGMMKGDVLKFAIWSNAGSASQRKVATTTRTVSWMKP